MHILEAFGRIFLSTLFLFEGVKKFFYQDETIEYMENFGVPEFLFYPSLIFEIVIPILLIIGFLLYDSIALSVNNPTIILPYLDASFNKLMCPL